MAGLWSMLVSRLYGYDAMMTKFNESLYYKSNMDRQVNVDRGSISLVSVIWIFNLIALSFGF